MKLVDRISQWLDRENQAQEAVEFHTRRAVEFSAKGMGHIVTARHVRNQMVFAQGNMDRWHLDLVVKYAEAKAIECYAEAAMAMALSLSVRTPFQVWCDRIIGPIGAVYVKYRHDTEGTRFE